LGIEEERLASSQLSALCAPGNWDLRNQAKKIADLPEPLAPMKIVNGSKSIVAFFSDIKFSTSIL
jgi:hypothetical protein